MATRPVLIRMLLVACFALTPLVIFGADEVRIDTPQRAVLALTNGRNLAGKLISLNLKEVRFQPAGSTEAKTYFVAQVKSVKTADDEYSYDAEAKGFVSAKGGGAKAVDKRDRPAAGKDSGTDAATETVIAEGVGKTAKSALKDAFRGALSKVVGTLVDAETLVKNDEVISDQVLEYSGGFVSSYDKLSEKEDDGLFRVKIKAQVERRQVMAKLKAAKVTIRAVDGKDLVAEVLTQQEARKNATALLEKELAELPKLLLAEVVGKPQYDESSASMVVGVAVSVDAAKYGAFAKRLTGLLDKSSLAKQSVLLAGQADKNAARKGGLVLDHKQVSVLGALEVDKLPGVKSWTLWVLTFMDDQAVRMRWSRYVLDADYTKCVAPITGDLRVHLVLADDKGETVTEDEFPLIDKGGAPTSYRQLLQGRSRTGDNHAWVLYEAYLARQMLPQRIDERIHLYVAPLAMQLEFYGTWASSYGKREQFQRKVKLTLRELERVKDIKCSVVLHRNLLDGNNN